LENTKDSIICDNRSYGLHNEDFKFDPNYPILPPVDLDYDIKRVSLPETDDEEEDEEPNYVTCDIGSDCEADEASDWEVMSHSSISTTRNSSSSGSRANDNLENCCPSNKNKNKLQFGKVETSTKTLPNIPSLAGSPSPALS